MLEQAKEGIRIRKKKQINECVENASEMEAKENRNNKKE